MYCDIVKKRVIEKVIPNLAIPSATVRGNLPYHRKHVDRPPAKSSKKHAGISMTSWSVM
jgi:hypothetical protein